MLRKLNQSLRRFNKLTTKNIHGYYFTKQPNTNNIEVGEKVSVYEGPEWDEINTHLNKNKYFSIVPRSDSDINDMNTIWENCVFETSFKKKYFSLLPFNIEDRHSLNAKKKFVLKMDLYPETKYLKFTYAMISGVHSVLEPLEDIIPVTPGDYKIRHQLLRSKPPHFLDVDMLYANKKVPSIYCFDIHGTWVKTVLYVNIGS